ncbi:MAG: DNRLRE domain-containing protein [Nitrospira sp.]|nr:DNRLRE domain-containing protein [Nitrospira sp.]
MFKLAYAAFDRVTGRPVFEDFGLVHIPMLGGGSVFVKEATGKFLPGIKPSFGATLLAERGPADTTNWVVFDLESFPMVLGATTARLTERQALHMEIYDIAHAMLPQAKFATYGDTGVENLHYSFTPATRAARLAHYQQWLPPIWNKAQGLVSQAYTLDDTFSHWEKVVRANIEDARILEPNKPHFIFLKPRFNVHDPDFANDPIPYSIWLAQLQFLASVLLDKDYVVVWEGQVAAWTQFAEENWWKATKDFLAASVPGPTPPPPTPSGLTATITADVYITSNSPTTNFATSISLKAKSSVDKAFLRVVVSGVPAQGVQSASLTLWVNNTTTGTLTLKSFAPTTPWVETDVTWNAQPQGVAGPVVSSIVAPTLDAITFTGLEGVINADGTYEFLLESTSATDGCDMSSTSEAISSARPFFTVVANIATCEESLAVSRAETAAIQAQLAEVEAAHAIAVDGLQDTIDSLNASLDVSNAKLESIRLVLDS